MGQVFYYRTVYPQHHIEEVVVNDYGAGESDLAIPHHRKSTPVSSSSSSASSSSCNDFTNERTSLLSTNGNILNSKSHASFTTIHSPQSLNTRYVVRLFFVSSILLWTGLLVGSALYFFGPGQKKVDMSQWHLIPQLLGWGSALLYCVSRIPQIMQNFRNESVEGLSLIMFIFSVVGNITYCVSIMLESTEPTYLLINYPWLLGSGGTLFFDFTIFFQFYMYRQTTGKK
ncbi:PQ loop repeat-domain-containing protein [Parasitella parasitica]|nr:PQ loop repeat-domain-containing protein [Parasitella parasitica]